MKHKYTGQIDSNMNSIRVGDILTCCGTFWVVKDWTNPWGIDYYTVANIDNDHHIELVEFLSSRYSDDLGVIIVEGSV